MDSDNPGYVEVKSLQEKDMLYYPAGDKTRTGQGALVEEEEIEKMVSFIKTRWRPVTKR